MSQALFYPWIDIQDETWLKTSLLYWDSLRTIVPESIDAPYSTETGRALQDAGFLVPLRVHSRMEEIEELTDDVLKYLNTSEGAELVIAGVESRTHHIHVDKLPYPLQRFANIHPDKLPDEIRGLLYGLAAPSNRGSDWLQVDDRFALFYMTLLANRLAERVGAGLVTSLPSADRLAVAARLDSQFNGIIPWGSDGPRPRRREYEAFGPRRRMPRQLAPGLLAQLALQQMAVAPDTPVDRLLDFREQHKDELGLFRTKIEQLTSAVDTDLSPEALRQRVSDLHDNEIQPAIANLKSALDGRRIRSLSNGLLMIAFLSAGPSTMLGAAGLAVPMALLAGAGISLIVSKIMYNADKQDSLRSNPYTYLLSVERELA
jgi:hypothetical protein